MSHMTIRLFDARFGRVALEAVAGSAEPRELSTNAILLACDPAMLEVAVGSSSTSLTRDGAVFLNPGESHMVVCDALARPVRVLLYQPNSDWLADTFPAMRDERHGRLFTRPGERLTPRMRRLADTLATEMLNDQFLAAGRLEFMLQELMLCVLDAYVARRTVSSRIWHGSPFEDSRMREALALLRTRPSMQVHMEDIARAVGLSRSRFYDLFQLCTGRSPRDHLDMLCVEAAIARLASREPRIAEVSAELGFSAQSNFTRFFLQQVGVPPSVYRRIALEQTTGGLMAFSAPTPAG